MEPMFQINPQLDIPIYQQLVDEIRAAAKKGTLALDQQLPTVQEMSQALSVARGTIKRAYDELERLGIVEKVQGRGTFVCYHPTDGASRKEQAMAAIDNLLDRLDSMGFSPAEINIYLNLKLRERAEHESRLKVALLECNPETLSQMSEQLRTIKGIDLYSHLLESIEQYPYKLGEDMDLVIVTDNHADYLEKVLPVRSRIARVALRLTPHCLSQIVKLRKGHKVAILCYSMRFGQLLYRTCLTYTEDVRFQEPVLLSAEGEIQALLQGKDVVLVPKAYEKYCTRQVLEQLRKFKGRLIECNYEMDEGSFLYLREKTKRLLEAKTI